MQRMKEARKTLFLCFPSKTPTAARACDVTQHLHQFDFFRSKSFNRLLDVEHYYVFSPHSSSSLSADRSSEQQGVYSWRAEEVFEQEGL